MIDVVSIGTNDLRSFSDATKPMGVVNRCAIGVQALEPLKQWLRQVDPEADEIFGHPARLCLIPEYGSDEEGEELIEECFDRIFEQELASWCRP